MKETGLLLAVLLGAAPLAVAGPRIPDGEVRQATLSFDGHGSGGDFTGVTDSVHGELRGADRLAGVSGWVEAPVVTLKTGNNRRDRDLNKSMQSDQFPNLRFELDSVGAEGGERTDSMPATLLGRLIIHGVTRDVALPSTLLIRNDGVRVLAGFPLNLKDYRIGGLSKMLGILRMDEHITVHVDVDFGFR
ncbi:MAG TPA: YceI family protein [Gemmatimonadales bacterium]|jgi:polyisoprenoid-binding protein YceI